MSSIYDVGTALKELAANAVYPSGTSQPSVADVDVKVVYGWPQKDKLDADILAGKAQVSIFPLNGMERQTNFYQRVWQPLNIPLPTLLLTVANNTITVGGTPSTPESCMVIVNGVGYAYEVQAGDTLATIATALASIIPNASAVGPVITIANAYSIIARVNVAGTSVRPLKTQERIFAITVWAPTPEAREAIGSAIEVLFAATQRIAMNDGFFIQMGYRSTYEEDDLQKGLIYRRDLRYAVEYTTTQTQTDYTITYPYANIESSY
jgi:hypothetical protein